MSGWCVDPPSPPPTSCKLCKLGYTSKVSWEQHPVQSSVLMLGYPHLTAFNRYNPAVLYGFLEGNVISVHVHNTDIFMCNCINVQFIFPMYNGGSAQHAILSWRNILMSAE